MHARTHTHTHTHMRAHTCTYTSSNNFNYIDSAHLIVNMSKIDTPRNEYYDASLFYFFFPSIFFLYLFFQVLKEMITEESVFCKKIARRLFGRYELVWCYFP